MENQGQQPLQDYAQTPVKDYVDPPQQDFAASQPQQPMYDQQPAQGYAQPMQQQYAQPAQGYAQPPQQYAQPAQGYAQPQQPIPQYIAQLKTKRGLLKFILLSLITFGIYGIVVMCEVSNSINTISSRYDGKHTMNYFLAMIIGSFTFGIYSIIWFHSTSGRVGRSLQMRGINYKFGASSFWLWYVLGAFILIGPCVYIHKLLTSMNRLSLDYNGRG